MRDWRCAGFSGCGSVTTCLRRAITSRFCGRLHVCLVLSHQLQLADLRPGVLNPLRHLQEMENSNRTFIEVQAVQKKFSVGKVVHSRSTAESN